MAEASMMAARPTPGSDPIHRSIDPIHPMSPPVARTCVCERCEQIHVYEPAATFCTFVACPLVWATRGQTPPTHSAISIGISLQTELSLAERSEAKTLTRLL